MDEQLPPAFAQWLREQGCEAVHVRECGLLRAVDAEIWKKAEADGAVVFTKDEDFVTLWRAASQPVPIVWIRIGNCTNRVLLGWFAPLWPEVQRKLGSGEKLIEIRR